VLEMEHVTESERCCTWTAKGFSSRLRTIEHWVGVVSPGCEIEEEIGCTILLLVLPNIYPI
jgi:hypothetical protein